MPVLRRLARTIPRSVRNWIRSPRATLAWGWDELRHRAGLDRSVDIRNGWTVRCHPFAYRMAYHVHLDDPEQVQELDCFIAECAPGMVLFDLGAHFGMFSLAAAHFGGSSARTVAVEPSAFASRMMRGEVRRNGAADQVTVVEAAVAGQPGRFEMVPVGVMAAGYFLAATAAHGPAERRTVRAVTVDELAREHGLWPTHIKVDVEGAEADALRGARETLARRPGPLLFLELHTAMLQERGENPGETLDLIDELGYRVFALDGRGMTRSEVLDRRHCRVIARPAGGPL